MPLGGPSCGRAACDSGGFALGRAAMTINEGLPGYRECAHLAGMTVGVGWRSTKTTVAAVCLEGARQEPA